MNRPTQEDAGEETGHPQGDERERQGRATDRGHASKLS